MPMFSTTAHAHAPPTAAHAHTRAPPSLLSTATLSSRVWQVPPFGGMHIICMHAAPRSSPATAPTTIRPSPHVPRAAAGMLTGAAQFGAPGANARLTGSPGVNVAINPHGPNVFGLGATRPGSQESRDGGEEDPSTEWLTPREKKQQARPSRRD